MLAQQTVVSIDNNHDRTLRTVFLYGGVSVRECPKVAPLPQEYNLLLESGEVIVHRGVGPQGRLVGGVVVNVKHPEVGVILLIQGSQHHVYFILDENVVAGRNYTHHRLFNLRVQVIFLVEEGVLGVDEDLLVGVLYYLSVELVLLKGVIVS